MVISNAAAAPPATWCASLGVKAEISFLFRFSFLLLIDAFFIGIVLWFIVFCLTGRDTI